MDVEKRLRRLRALAARARRSLRVLLLTALVSGAAVLAAGLVLPHLLLWIPAQGDSRRPGGEAAVTLFAHRGGVRLAGVPDNSLAALRAAIERGYDGVEVDVRETADGVLVAHHDVAFGGHFASSCRSAGFVVCPGGDGGACADVARRRGLRPCRVDEMTAAEVERLVDSRSGVGVPTLAEFLAVAGGAGLQVMLDFKEELSPEAMDDVERLLDAHLPDRPVYLIGKTDPKLALTRRHGNGRFGVIRPVHPAAFVVGKLAARGEPFVFQSGVATRRDDLAYSASLGVELIPTLNWHHLGGRTSGPAREMVIAAAHRELRRLYELGVRTFQIDSEFDGFFFDAQPRASASRY